MKEVSFAKKKTKEKNTITVYKILHKIHSALKIFYEICKVFKAIVEMFS